MQAGDLERTERKAENNPKVHRCAANPILTQRHNINLSKSFEPEYRDYASYSKSRSPNSEEYPEKYRMMSSEKRNHERNTHVDLVLDWLLRASVEKEKQKNEDPSALSWGTIQQLNKTTWLLGAFQVVLIILFATVAGDQVKNCDFCCSFLLSHCCCDHALLLHA